MPLSGAAFTLTSTVRIIMPLLPTIAGADVPTLCWVQPVFAVEYPAVRARLSSADQHL